LFWKERERLPEGVVETTPEMAVPQQLQKDTGIEPVKEPTIPPGLPVKEVGKEKIEVEIPDEKILKAWQKAKPKESKRWLAAFFERLKKMLGFKR